MRRCAGRSAWSASTTARASRSAAPASSWSFAETRAAETLQQEFRKQPGAPALVSLDAQLEGAPETLRMFRPAIAAQRARLPLNSVAWKTSASCSPAGPRAGLRRSNFRLEKAPLPQPQDGEVLVKNLWLSLDPYMRGRISEVKSYAKGVEIGETMVGQTVGEVLESKSDKFRKGRPRPDPVGLAALRRHE